MYHCTFSNYDPTLPRCSLLNTFLEENADSRSHHVCNLFIFQQKFQLIKNKVYFSVYLNFLSRKSKKLGFFSIFREKHRREERDKEEEGRVFLNTLVFFL